MSGLDDVQRRLSSTAVKKVPVLTHPGLGPPPIGATLGAAWAISVAAGPGERSHGALWRLHSGADTGLSGLGTLASAGPSARQAIDAAHSALAQLPWGWQRLPSEPLSVLRVDDLSAVAVGPPDAVHGRSLTLSALLALASRYYNVPLSDSVVASADIGPTGALVAVQWEHDKVKVLRRLLPGLRTLAVAKSQVDSWKRALEIESWGCVEVKGYANATEAVKDLLNPQAKLLELDPNARKAQLVHLRSLALSDGMTARVNWSAVKDNAAYLQSHAPKAADASWQPNDLALIELVAARYARTKLIPPDESVCAAAADTRSMRMRALKLSQLIQQFADLAVDLPAVLAATVPAAFDGRLGHRVRGAWCRWRLVVGQEPIEERARIALDGHRKNVETLLEDEEYNEISHSLSALLYLAGALEDQKAYEYALGVAEDLSRIPEVTPADLAFVRLARGRAAVWMPGADRRAAHRDLTALADALPKVAHDQSGPLAGLHFMQERIKPLLGVLNTAGRIDLLTDPEKLDATIETLSSTRQPYARAIAGPPSDPPAARAARFDRFFAG